MVSPVNFINDLRRVLSSVPPLAGEEARYQVAQNLIDLADSDTLWSEQIHTIAAETETRSITPMFDFSHASSTLAKYGKTIGCQRQQAPSSCTFAFIRQRRPS